MRKSVWIFFLAILVPSTVLGWLALRSARQQEVILERQTAELYQHETDQVAAAVRARIDEQRRAFTEHVQALLTSADAASVAHDFAPRLAAAWPRKAAGFSLDATGRVLSPAPGSAANRTEWQQQAPFISGKAPASVYNVPVDALNAPALLRKQKVASADYRQIPATEGLLEGRDSKAPRAKATEAQLSVRAKSAPPIPTAPAPAPAIVPKPAAAAAPAKKEADRAPAPEEKFALAPSSPPAGPDASNAARLVQPQQVADAEDRAVLSQIVPELTEFQALTRDRREGLVSRFVQDKLSLVLWLRPVQAPELVFGCVIDAAALADLWQDLLPSEYRRGEVPPFILALLDDRARPVALSPAGSGARDWKRPFVATEIGEALPHWEAALYLMRPEQIHESASGLQWTLIFLVVAMLGAILLGGWLVFADARRQLALAQQKTDFVSNVSHELKTPLTSIRMFAELMLGARPDMQAKSPQYLRIIMVEAERLTRLINNVLDFARLERKQKRFEKKLLDLHAVIAGWWEGQELHLRAAGFTVRWEAAAGPYPVVGDEDALIQILVNLLSNAEKYGGERKEIELHSYLDAGHVYCSVLDRGPGVPPGSERKIFEAFYRAHDSLSSGIQGSGLGLTLAQRLAHEHEGSLDYRPREGGGSAFTLRLPLAPESVRRPLPL